MSESSYGPVLTHDRERHQVADELEWQFLKECEKRGLHYSLPGMPVMEAFRAAMGPDGVFAFLHGLDRLEARLKRMCDMVDKVANEIESSDCVLDRER